VPWDAPLTLLGESPDQLAAAQRDLARIGFDRLAGAASGGAGAWCTGAPASYPVAGFADLADARREQDLTILDVRRALEWAAWHIAGARHIPLHELAGRVGELPDGPLWVHCQAGYRACVAASLLQAAGREVTAVDDQFEHAVEAGLPLLRGSGGEGDAHRPGVQRGGARPAADGRGDLVGGRVDH
jgi:rhodanese-related sulfurtransferase